MIAIEDIDSVVLWEQESIDPKNASKQHPHADSNQLFSDHRWVLSEVRGLIVTKSVFVIQVPENAVEAFSALHRNYHGL